MTFSLYDAIIPTYVQILGAVRGLLDKAEAFSATSGLTHGEIMNARITEDMLPLSAQICFVAAHSFGAIEGVRAGQFTPTPPADAPADLAALKTLIDDAITGLEAVTAEEMTGFIGRDMRFLFPPKQLEIPFTAENYLLSFAQPNFYFHATTTYDILRGLGVTIGKPDFLGQLRFKAD